MTEHRADGPRAVAVVFAGGVGARMDQFDGLPKQLIEVRGKPILIYTLQHFQQHPDIDAIYLAAIAEYLPDVRGLVDAYGIDKVRTIVAGGDSAHASIRNGLQAAVADGNPADTVVLVHDGVRPVINTELIDRNIAAVLEHGTAITSIPAFETVAESDADALTVARVPDRHRMRVLQAPQSFRLGEIVAVNQRAEDDGLLGRFVDQAQLMRHYGRALHMIDGLRGNVKLTVPLDVVFFDFLVESGEYKQIVEGGCP